MVGTYLALPQKANSEEKRLYAWLHTKSRLINLMRNPSRKHEGKLPLSPPKSFSKAVQTEMVLRTEKRVCENCRTHPVYLDIATMNWCEQCLWESLQKPE